MLIDVLAAQLCGDVVQEVRACGSAQEGNTTTVGGLGRVIAFAESIFDR